MVVTDLVDACYAGNARTLRFTVLDQDAPGSPPKDLTGLGIRWALTRFSGGGDPLSTPVLDKDTANAGQITIVDAINGVLEVNLAEGDTTSLLGDYYFELEVYSTGSFSLVVATGTETIRKNVTNT